MREDHLFCMNCGKRIERPQPASIQKTRPPADRLGKKMEKVQHALTESERSPVTQSKGTMESIIGGFASSDMLRPGKGIGYGLYITNKRVIGVKRPDQLTKSIAGAIAGAVVGKVLGFEAPWAVSSALGRALSTDESRRLIVELEKNKDFEAYKQDITLIQLKGRGIVDLGQLAIFLKGEKTTNNVVAFKSEKVYEKLKEMFQSWHPQALRLV
jgi:hypothetical protein